jgi:hypothetical protein
MAADPFENEVLRALAGLERLQAIDVAPCLITTFQLELLTYSW